MKKAGIVSYGSIPFSSLSPLINCRNKALIPENSRSVILVLIPYNVGDFPKRNISKYAVSADYHLIAKELLGGICESLKELFPREKFQFFADNSPINEVDAALKANLGVLGKNGLLINKDFGSYVFIGEIVTTAEILPYENGSIKSCLNCGKCLAACPYGAISKEGFKEELCLSSLSQKKGELSQEEKEKIRKNGLVWGCDICQDVCPLNHNVKLTNIKAFYDTALPEITEENVEEVIKTRAFNWRGIKTIKRNLEILREDK